MLSIKPKFYQDFNCIGSACADVCCRGWSLIHIDKKTYRKYKKSDRIYVKQFVDESIEVLNESPMRYAKIILNENNVCPALDQQGLCLIHRDLGEDALSYTCKTYPRVVIDNKSEFHYTLSLSCTEAARLVLFGEDSMQFNEIESPDNKSDEDIDLTILNQKLLNLFYSQFVLPTSHSPELQLTGIVHFTQKALKHDLDIVGNIELFESYYAELITNLEATKLDISGSIELRNTHVKMKLLFLNSITKVLPIDTSIQTRGYQTIVAANQVLRDYFDQFNAAKQLDFEAKLCVIDNQWRMLMASSAVNFRQAIKNYLLYRFYSMPISATKDRAFKDIYYLVIDYFYIKCVLSVKSLTSELSEADMISLIYSLHAFTQHGSGLVAFQKKLINELNLGDDLSSLLFLSETPIS